MLRRYIRVPDTVVNVSATYAIADDRNDDMTSPAFVVVQPVCPRPHGATEIGRSGGTRPPKRNTGEACRHQGMIFDERLYEC